MPAPTSLVGTSRSCMIAAVASLPSEGLKVDRHRWHSVHHTGKAANGSADLSPVWIGVGVEPTALDYAEGLDKFVLEPGGVRNIPPMSLGGDVTGNQKLYFVCEEGGAPILQVMPGDVV